MAVKAIQIEQGFFVLGLLRLLKYILGYLLSKAGVVWGINAARHKYLLVDAADAAMDILEEVSSKRKGHLARSFLFFPCRHDNPFLSASIKMLKWYNQ